MEPLTDEQVIAAFGDPLPFMLNDGTVSPGWEQRILAFAALPAPLVLAWDRSRTVSAFRCHHRLVPHFEGLMLALFNDPEVWATINDFGGCYAWRMQRRARTPSRHSWAIALDMDVAENPFGRAPKTHPRFEDIVEAHGFAWGGNFKGARKDGMHVEFADIGRLT